MIKELRDMIHTDLDEIDEELERLTEKKAILENALEKPSEAEELIEEAREDLEDAKS